MGTLGSSSTCPSNLLSNLALSSNILNSNKVVVGASVHLHLLIILGCSSNLDLRIFKLCAGRVLKTLKQPSRHQNQQPLARASTILQQLGWVVTPGVMMTWKFPRISLTTALGVRMVVMWVTVVVVSGVLNTGATTNSIVVNPSERNLLELFLKQLNPVFISLLNQHSPNSSSMIVCT